MAPPSGCTLRIWPANGWLAATLLRPPSPPSLPRRCSMPNGTAQPLHASPKTQAFPAPPVKVVLPWYKDRKLIRNKRDPATTNRHGQPK